MTLEQSISCHKAAIRAQLEKLTRLNQTRADFAEKFEELIESYNTGSRNIEELFEELVKLSRNLTEEQQRHVRENMTEEELVILDILTRPAPELTADERAEVKKVARIPLDRLKQLLVINWRQKSREHNSNSPSRTLDTLPAAYDRPLYAQKCSALFEHVYESYPQRDTGVYGRGRLVHAPAIRRFRQLPAAGCHRIEEAGGTHAWRSTGTPRMRSNKSRRGFLAPSFPGLCPRWAGFYPNVGIHPIDPAKHASRLQGASCGQRPRKLAAPNTAKENS
jgi:hypothetical protein